jgi:hypothetical protein
MPSAWHAPLSSIPLHAMPLRSAYAAAQSITTLPDWPLPMISKAR